MSEIHPADKDKQEVLISESDLVTDINNVFTTKQTSEEKESKKLMIYKKLNRLYLIMQSILLIFK